MTTKRQGIDYSKWDNFKDDDDEDDEIDEYDGNHSSWKRPHVTRFDEPMSVTINSSSTSFLSAPATATIATTATTATTSTTATTNNNNNQYNRTSLVPNQKITPPYASVKDSNPSTSSLVLNEPTTCPTFPPTKWIEKGGKVVLSFVLDGSNGFIVTDDSISHLQSDDTIETSMEDSNSHLNPTSPKLPLYWCQDRVTVTIRFPIDNESVLLLLQEHYHHKLGMDRNSSISLAKKGMTWNCHVSNLLPYEDRLNAVGMDSEPQKLHIIVTILSQGMQGIEQSITTSKQNSQDTAVLSSKPIVISFLELTLPHPTYLPSDDDDVDWSIETVRQNNHTDNDFEHGIGGGSSNSTRFLVVTMYKATPMAGLTLWWKKPFKECQQEIALTWQENGNNNNSFQTAWNQAHEQFLENRKSNNQCTPLIID